MLVQFVRLNGHTHIHAVEFRLAVAHLLRLHQPDFPHLVTGARQLHVVRAIGTQGHGTLVIGSTAQLALWRLVTANNTKVLLIVLV